MGLHVHRADRTDVLARGLGDLLATPLADPFAEELVLVSARGLERWLSQRLSHVLGRGDGPDGVCAGITFRSPASLVAELTGTLDDDPWSPDAMAWPLLDVIDASLDQPWCRSLATHLGGTGTDDESTLRRGRRYAVARRLAGLFASYARQRPQLLIDWLNGTPSDGVGATLPEDLQWQPQLWRALVARVDVEPPHVRHANAIAALRQSPVAHLPSRLSLFGHTRLAAADVELVDALATHHDVHLWLPHPSDPLWRALDDVRGAVPRRADRSHDRAAHPLLDTLGRDVRELQRGLPSAATDEWLGDATKPDTMLGWLQSDVNANGQQPGGRLLRADDRSVQIHRCHGPARQIDVLRDVLLGLLADDHTLEPRDILVMCPDIETYAPLIVAAFGLGDLVGDNHPAQRLRVRLADRSPTHTNPLLAAATRLLALADSRATASQVLDFAHAAPVRSRFGFTDDDLDAIAEWVGAAGIRWGFDSSDRDAYQLSDYPQNTWRFGVDRILTGVGMSDDSQAWLGTALPLDDVGSDRIELAGRITSFVHRLNATTARLTGVGPLHQWLDTVRAGLAALTRVESDDVWQQGQVDRVFSKVLSEAGSGADTELSLSDVRALLDTHLAARPTRANFRTGTLTVCTMVPMRSVPHRVVCLVGLDDGVYPRQNAVDGDDVLARQPMTGERDIRSEDRQLLLDAIAAATDTLVITYTGIDETTGDDRPPAVPLQELVDALDQTTSEPVRDRVVARHPLQPFDAANVEPGKIIAGEPFTFDPVALRGALAATGQRVAPGALIGAEPLPQLPSDDVELADLLQFFEHPVKGFFRALDYTLPWEEDELSDAIPIELDHLQQWAVGDRMLDDLLRGRDLDFVTKAEWRRGTLPPGRLGWRQATASSNEAAELAMHALRLQAGRRRSALDVDVHLGGGRRLTGTVSPVWADRTVSVKYSRLGAKQLLQAWISLVALTAAIDGRDWTAYCVGRGVSDDEDVVAERSFGCPPRPLAVLRDLVAIYDAGRREPLPLPLKSSLAWAQRRLAGGHPAAYAKKKWDTGEAKEPAHLEVWRGNGYDGAPFDVLLVPPRPGEETDDEDTRLGAYASRLWLPMLRAERSR